MSKGIFKHSGDRKITLKDLKYRQIVVTLSFKYSLSFQAFTANQ